jgi:hypothetical protein
VYYGISQCLFVRSVFPVNVFLFCAGELKVLLQFFLPMIYFCGSFGVCWYFWFFFLLCLCDTIFDMSTRVYCV